MARPRLTQRTSSGRATRVLLWEETLDEAGRWLRLELVLLTDDRHLLGAGRHGQWERRSSKVGAQCSWLLRQDRHLAAREHHRASSPGFPARTGGIRVEPRARCSQRLETDPLTPDLGRVALDTRSALPLETLSLSERPA